MEWGWAAYMFSHTCVCMRDQAKMCDQVKHVRSGQARACHRPPAYLGRPPYPYLGSTPYPYLGSPAVHLVLGSV